jgi:hypothetical protein
MVDGPGIEPDRPKRQLYRLPRVHSGLPIQLAGLVLFVVVACARVPGRVLGNVAEELRECNTLLCRANKFF